MGVRSEDRSASITAAVRAALIEGTAAAALYVEGVAKGMCPVRTGNLRRSIHSEQVGNGPHYRVGPDTPYDIYVEYGTSRQSAQPYMRPAYDQVEAEPGGVQGIIKEFVTDAIVTSAGKPSLRG